MLSMLRRRLTYANVIATIALFAALGGTSYGVATGFIDSREIKNGTIRTADVRNNDLRGADIRESSLATVPSAAAAASAQNAQNAESAHNAQAAQTAQNAENASTVGGIAAARINYAEPVSPGSETILSGGGLTLEATCTGNQDIAITATTSKQDSSIYTAAVNTRANDNILASGKENGEFDVGTTLDLLAGGSGNPDLITFEYNAADGTSVTGTLAVNEAGLADCEAYGHAFVG